MNVMIDVYISVENCFLPALKSIIWNRSTKWQILTNSLKMTNWDGEPSPASELRRYLTEHLMNSLWLQLFPTLASLSSLSWPSTSLSVHHTEWFRDHVQSHSWRSWLGSQGRVWRRRLRRCGRRYCRCVVIHCDLCQDHPHHVHQLSDWRLGLTVTRWDDDTSVKSFQFFLFTFTCQSWLFLQVYERNQRSVSRKNIPMHWQEK